MNLRKEHDEINVRMYQLVKNANLRKAKAKLNDAISSIQSLGNKKTVMDALANTLFNNGFDFNDTELLAQSLYARVEHAKFQKRMDKIRAKEKQKTQTSAWYQIASKATHRRLSEISKFKKEELKTVLNRYKKGDFPKILSEYPKDFKSNLINVLEATIVKKAVLEPDHKSTRSNLTELIFRGKR